jgi:hypothetical protein
MENFWKKAETGHAKFYQLLFLFCDKFVDGAQAEVAGDFAGRRHILVTLIVLGVLTWIGGY